MNVVGIQIGGIGEGKTIWEKQLEAMARFSSPVANGADGATAADKLLVSSPLKERHYADPMGEVFVDMAAGSPEFSRLGADMQTSVDQIRRGMCTSFLRYWFTREVADALPERVAEVEIGTGAQAVLSRGAADLEAKRIVGEIRQAVRRARAGDDHTLVIVGGGAGTGGTSTGAFIEILRLVRIVADTIGHVTVIAMPVLGARGCEMLYDSQQEVQALHSRSYGAYLTICAGQAAPHAVPYALAENLVVEARQLADIVWVVQGDQGDPSSPGREPMFGLARAAAGIVEALTFEQGALAGAIPNWRIQAAQSNSSARMGSAGAASVRIDGLHLWKQASLQLALAFYDALLKREEGALSEGEMRASQILASFFPAAFVRAYASGEPVAWLPPDAHGERTIAGLAEQMTDRDGESGPFPCSPKHDIKWLPDEIHTAGWSNFCAISNKSVVENADATITAYMGDTRARRRRDDDWTVLGWLVANRQRLVAEFAAIIEAEMLERSIDENTGLPYTLRQKPNTILDTRDLLMTLHDRIRKFKVAAQRVVDAASPLLEERAAAHAKARAEMLDARNSGPQQRRFLQIAQADLDVRVWHAEMSAWIEVASGWMGVLDRWLDEVGSGASGWHSYLTALREDLRVRGEELLARRRKLDCASNHAFVPRTGEAGEKALLDELALASGALDALLGQCRFVWKKTEDGAPQLYLEGLAPAPSREREAVVQRLRELNSARANDYKVTNHVSADTVHYTESALRSDFEGLTVFDGLAFDYTHIAIPEAERKGDVPDLEEWARGVLDEFLAGSRAELALNGDGQDGVFRERVVWGPLAIAGVHPVAHRIAQAVRQRLDDGTYNVVDTPVNRTCLYAFECLLRVPFDAIELFDTMLSHMALVPDTELGIYAPEMAVRTAERRRRLLARRGIKRLPWTFCPSVTTVTADADGTDSSLRRAALGIVMDLFDTIPGRGTRADHLGIVVDRRMLADLGEGDALTIIENLRDPMNEAAAEELDARIEDFVSGYRDPSGALDASLPKDLEDAADAAWRKKTESGTREQQDLHLLLLAEVLDVAEAYARRCEGSSPAPRPRRGHRLPPAAPSIAAVASQLERPDARASGDCGPAPASGLRRGSWAGPLTGTRAIRG